MENNDSNHCYYSGLPSPFFYESTEKEEEKPSLSDIQIDRIIEMAWEDRTPFEAISNQFGLNESAVRSLMKKELRVKSYILWRKRVEASKLKHLQRRAEKFVKFKSSSQSTISNNKISKR
jgi:uncharacterized protein (TIGR03643 family)